MVEKKDEDANRAKFLAALEKKKKSSVSGSSVGPNAGSKIDGGLAGGGASKRFQRKSGSA